MKYKLLYLASACFSVLLTPFSASANLFITEVMSSSAHAGGTNNGDWFELTNAGASSIDLSTYSWDDNTNTSGSSLFGNTIINAGQSIIFSEETVGAEAAWKTAWGLTTVTVVNLGSAGFQGLGAGGDAVNVYDSLGTNVASVTFGAATSGYSFEWDTSGQSLGLSVIGENGAYQALSNGQTTGSGPGIDVGSPGSAVPEPSTIALEALAFGFALLLKRRKINPEL